MSQGIVNFTGKTGPEVVLQFRDIRIFLVVQPVSNCRVTIAGNILGIRHHTHDAIDLSEDFGTDCSGCLDQPRPTTRRARLPYYKRYGVNVRQIGRQTQNVKRRIRTFINSPRQRNVVIREEPP